MQKERRGEPSLTVRYPHCAGLDVGKKELYVAVADDAAVDNVRTFGTYTAALKQLSSWLRDGGVQQVAMEATGVYWIPVYELLERAGFEVRLVDPRATKRLDGRKSDVLDCQGIRQMMSMGMLSGAYRTPDAFCALRSYVRQRARLIQERSRQVLHMQKALTQMNVQLDNVLSELVGKSGLAILRSIVAGERDPWVLAQHRDGRIRATEAEVARSLEGNWRDEHLHELAAALRHFDFLEREIQQLELLIGQEAAKLVWQPEDHDSHSNSGGAPEMRKLQQPCRKARDRHRQLMLWEVAGVDLTAITGVGLETALFIVSELGADVSAFPTEKHFCSWLGLAPNNQISGGNVLRNRRRKANRLGQAF
ncbi:MAG: IS110 family transposase, partial [Gammaproteobacteria bacterium]|nr:IS110 family transposase [Gammaproteobacteria bacterium]